MVFEMRELLATIVQVGRVRWIGVRPGRREPISCIQRVQADVEAGLIGDRFVGKPGAVRQVTLIQHEHIQAVNSIMGTADLDPALLRRNIVVSGINLQSLKNRNFRIGSAIFYGTGNCAPCSRMEQSLGTGGYNAMRGHGGITAYVVEPGFIEIDDQVVDFENDSLKI